jgi:hypothetical protein
LCHHGAAIDSLRVLRDLDVKMRTADIHIEAAGTAEIAELFRSQQDLTISLSSAIAM